MTDRATAVETAIGAPLETVWAALRDPAAIRRWHGWEYDGLDDEIDEIYFQGVEVDEAAGTIDISDGSRFAVERVGGRTVVRVTMPARPGDADWASSYDDIREGWTSFVMQLAFALERHRGEDRRTLQLEGAGPEPLLPATIGLGGAHLPGLRYSSETAWGERLAGHVLYRNEHQIGLTVNDYGPGLVILHAKPPQVRPPNGGGMAIVTTYGLDDDAFAALERRWSDWWRERYC